jgi:polyvinyl alcohol dehydrogenase (cytochrome)
MSLRGIALTLVSAISLSSMSIAADWPMYGHDITQSRSNPGETTITTTNVASLKQLWAFKTAAPVSSTPTVVNGVVYFGSWDHNFYAVNAATGALLWKVSLATPQGDNESFPGIQSSALVFGSRVYFGDSCGYLHGYAANGSGAQSSSMTVRNRGCGSTGTELPGFPIDLAGALPNASDAPHADLFSSPVPFTPTIGANKGRPLLYIGEASHVDNPCIHGAEFAIDAKSGKIVWRFDVTPSSSIGGGVWSSPAIDATNNLVYIDTGDCVNNASAGFSESVIALDASCSGVSVDGSCKNLASEIFPPTSPTRPGNPVWFFQAHPNGEIADLDFGSSPNVIARNGVPVLVGAGSKDGVYYAVNAGRAGGQLAWSTKVAEVSSVTIGTSLSSAVGGFNGSTGFANQKIYGTTVDGPEFEVALDAMTGTLAWNAADAVSSFSAIGLANGIVYAGDNTGLIKARDASTGLLLFEANVNGAVAGSPVPAEGKLFVPVGANTAPPGQQFGVYAFGL